MYLLDVQGCLQRQVSKPREVRKSLKEQIFRMDGSRTKLQGGARFKETVAGSLIPQEFLRVVPEGIADCVVPVLPAD